LRLSAIDLGGGMTMNVGGTKISTGSTIQDMGKSYLRDNGVVGLTAHQSTEFGQGFRREPEFSNKTHDFGCRFQQFNPANVGQQATGQLLNRQLLKRTSKGSREGDSPMALGTPPLCTPLPFPSI